MVAIPVRLIPPEVIVTADPTIAEVVVTTPDTLIPLELIVTLDPTTAEDNVETPETLNRVPNKVFWYVETPTKVETPETLISSNSP